MGVVAILLKNKSLVMMGILLLALAGSSIRIKILKSDVATVTAKAEVLAGELEVSQASVRSLQQAIKDQNSAIDKLKEDSDKRFAKHQAEVNKAKAVAASYKKQAEQIMISKVPPDQSNCDAANNLFNGELQNAK
jgi:uncharacterized protein YlxW (UPF0749 family)